MERADVRVCPASSTINLRWRVHGGTSPERRNGLQQKLCPPRDERSLPDEVYLEIVVFILRANKVPVGPHELKPDPETLKQITIAEPK